MKDSPHPLLLINIDETGFSRRRQKGKIKSFYILNKCKIELNWNKDIHHISHAVAITVGCTYLRSLYLSPRKILDEDIIDTFFNFWGEVYVTP